jgi:hypothetical protein
VACAPPRAQIDITLAGILTANMLQSQLDEISASRSIPEATDDLQSRRPPQAEASLHLRSTVDPGPSATPSGEHGAPVCCSVHLRMSA